MHRRSVRTLVLGTLIFVALAPVSSWGKQHDVFDPDQTKAIERIARDYILRNPEILVEALRVLEARQAVAEDERRRAVLAAKRDELENDPGSPIAGNPNGSPTIVEFFDYRCPYCKAVAPRLARLLKEDPQLRFVYKEWPILGPVSEYAAKVALAAHGQDQGKYRAFHDALMAIKGRLTEQMVFDTAGRLGLDVERLRREMNSPEIAAIINRNKLLADSLGITGTPAFVIGDTLVPGAASQAQLEALVNRARQGS